MFFIDGTFQKSKHYDGVLIQLCAKHGFGGTFQLMAAWLPRETAAHMAYFVMLMKEMGFDIENVPFMSDRGHLLAAASLLIRVSGLVISIKFCLEHIIRNVVGKFCIGIKQIRDLRTITAKMQSATSYSLFMESCDRLKEIFGNRGELMCVYLLRIHPRHWTVFGNLTSINDDTWMPQYAAILRGYMIRTQTGDAEDISNL